MKRQNFTFLGTVIVVIALLAQSIISAPLVASAASTPAVFSYQGRLTDSLGNLLGGNGTTYYFKFSLWDDPNAGTRVWPATAPGTFPTVVRQGVFNVNIGDTNAGYPDALNYTFDNPNIYLQVEVSTNGSSFETLSPRQQIASQAFAQVAGAVISASSTIATLVNTNLTSVNSTTTNATTSTFAITSLANALVKTNALGAFVSASAGDFFSTTSASYFLGTSLTSITDLVANRATTTNATSTTLAILGSFTGAGLTNCNSSTDKLLWINGHFTCGVDAGSTGSGITGIGAQYSGFQTGAAQVLATSSDTNIGLTITSSGDVHTFTPSWIGVLAASRGGTGIPSPSAAGVLLGSFNGSGYQQIATSSLGLLTTNVAEGSNQYFTNGRVQGYLDTLDKGYFFSTTSVGYWKSVNNFFSTTSADAYLATKSTDNLSEGASSLYFTQNHFDVALTATTSLPRLTTLLGLLDTVTARGTTTNATSTTLFAATASTTNLFFTAANGGSITSSGAGTFANILTLGSSTLQNFTFANATGSNATTTTFFTTTGSTTNLYFTTGSGATLALSGALTARNATTTALAVTSVQSSLLKTNNLGSVVAAVAGTDYVASANGDWTGTFSGQSASYYLANSFSTTSATYWKSVTDFFSTTSANAFLATKTTDNLTEGSINQYFTQGHFDSALEATTTLNNLAVLKGVTDLNAVRSTTTNATSTNLFASNLAATTLTLTGTNGLLNFTNGIGSAIATSSLGLLTTNVVEGSNLYFRNDRVQTYLDTLDKGYYFSTTSVGYWKSVNNFFSTTSADNFLANRTADNLPEGVTNQYFTQNRFDIALTATTTLPKLTTLLGLLDTVTARSTTTNATSTTLFATTASSTNLYFTSANGGSITSSGAGTFANILTLGSTTLQNFTFANATGSAATTTTFFTTTGSTTNLYFTTGSGATLALSGSLTTSNLLATSSSTLQNFTGLNSTTTNATTTSLAISTIGSKLLKTNAQGSVVGAVAGTDYIANTSGDWAGTFNGQTASYYLANSFSTTSANFWKSVNNFFSTTSADAYLATKTSDDITQGTTNKYFTQSNFDSALEATTTLNNIAVLKGVTDLIATRATTTKATTTSLAITGIASKILKTDANGSVIPAVAGVDYLSAAAAGISSLAAQYSSPQTGPAQTLATSSDANINLTITSSGDTHTFTPSWVGVLAANRGGTGIGSPSAAGILLGAYSGGGYQQLATSSLGLLTTNVAEGSNQYFTSGRVQSYLDTLDKGYYFSTTSVGYWKSVNNFFSTTSADAYLATKTTDNLTEGSTNRYFTQTNFDSALAATTTLNNLAVLRGITDFIATRGTTTNATSTNLFASTASSTNLFFTSANGGSITSSGLGTFSNILAIGSSTLQNFSALNSTSTNATTTTFFTTTGSSTNLFFTAGNGGTLTLSGILSSSNILANGSTTLQNFTALNATTTNATTTSFFATTASTSKLYLATGNGILKVANGLVSLATSNTDYQSPVTLTTTGSSGVATFNGTTLNIPNYGAGSYSSTTLLGDSNTFSGNNTFANLLVNGSSTLQNFTFVNATGSSATTTSFFAGTASSTNLYAAIGKIGNLTSTALTASAINLSGASGILNFYNGVGGAIATSSLGLLTTNVAEGSNQYFTNGRVQTYLDTLDKGYFFSTTSANAFLATKTTDNLTEGTVNKYFTQTNFDSALEATTTLNNLAVLKGITDLIATRSTTTNATTTTTFATTASSTNLYFTAAQGGAITSSGLGTFSNILTVGSSTLQNFTFVNATGSAATTTTFFTTTGSTTNLFFTAGNGGTLALSGMLTTSNILTTGSTTLQNFTALNATTTNATSTSLAISSIVSKILKTTANGSVIAAISNTDYQAPVTLTTTGTAGAATFNGTTLNIPNYGAGSYSSTTLLGDNNTFSGNNTFSNPITGSVTGNAGTATALQNARTINNVSFNGTSNIVITAASSTLLGDVNNFAALNTFANILASGSSTLQNFTGLNSTTTNATTTTLFATTASSTNLFSTFFTTGSLTANGTINGQTLSSAASLSGTLSVASGLTTLANLLAAGSSTLQNFTFVNATGSQATTSALAISSIVSKLLKTNANGSVVGAIANTDYQSPITLTTTGTSGASTFNGTTFNIPQYNGASTTLLGDNNTFAGNNTFSNTITGSVSGNAGTATALQNARTINNVSFNGTANITITAASSTLLGDVNNFAALNTFANLLASGSSTLQNFTGLNSTTSNATSTALFATTASSTNLFSTFFTTGSLTANGTINGQTISSAASLSGTLSVASGLTTLANLLATGSSTLQNFTALNSTSTNATTTSLAVSSIISKLLKTNGNGSVVGAVANTDYQSPVTLTTTGSSGAATFNGTTLNIPNYGAGSYSSTTLLGDNNAFAGNNSFANLLVSGSSTLQNFTGLKSTTTNATTTSLAISSVVSKLLKTDANGSVVAAVAGSDYITTATDNTSSSTLYADNGTFTGKNTFSDITATRATATQATTTNFAVSSIANALLTTNGTGSVIAYGGTSCTNQFVRSLSALGSATCNSVAIGSDVSGLGTGVATFLGTPSSANLITALTDETGTGNAVFSNLPTLAGFLSTASSTIGGGTQGSGLTINGQATTTNLLVTSSSTLQNFTFVTATGTAATTTNFFATTASSTNLFSTFFTTGLLTANGTINSQTISAAASLTGTLNVTSGLTTLANLLATGSSTLQNFTGLNSTTTNATTTSLAISNIVSKLLKTNGNGSVVGAVANTDYQSPVTLTTTGSSGVATFNGTTLNIPNYGAGTFSSTTLLGDNNTFSGTNTFSALNTFTNLLVSGSSTLQNFTALNSTSTNATTTSFFATTASSTNLFSTLFTTGSLTANGTINGQTISALASLTGTLNVTGGLTTLSNALVTGSSTLQNFTALNSTSTNATTTSLAISSIVSKILKTNGSGSVVPAVAGTDYQAAITPAALTKSDDTNVTLTLGGSPSTALLAATSLTLGWTGTLADSRVADNLTVSGGVIDNTIIGGTTAAAGTFTNILATGSSTLQNFTFINATGSSATTTNFFATTASTTSFFGAGLFTCNSASNALTFNGGKFGCNTISAGATASSTLLGDNNHFTGIDVIDTLTSTNSTSTTFSTTKASTTNLWIDSVKSALLVTNSSGSVAAYGGAAACTNQVVTALSALGVTTCATVSNAMLANSTISGVALGGTLGALSAADSTLTFSANYDGSVARTVGINLAATNNWTAGLLSTASTTIGNGTQGGGLTINGLATTTNVLVTSSSTLQNFTFVNATGSSATTTNFFATTASSTNLFSTNFTTGSLIANGTINGQTISALASLTGTLNVTSGLTTLSNLLATGSSTFQNFTGLNSTTTNATTTSLAISSITSKILKTNGNGSIVPAVAGTDYQAAITPAALTKADDTNVTLTLGGTPASALLQSVSLTLGWTGTLADSRVADNLTISGGTIDNSVIGGTTAAAGTFTNILATGSSTLQNFTFVNATGSSATTTNFFATTASTSNLFAAKFGGAGLTSCSSASSALTWNSSTSLFGCNSITGGGGSNTDKFATTTGSFLAITPNASLNVGLGIGTSTPAWAFQIASSTRPQLALSDGSLTSNHWTLRNAGGILYFATASPTTFATSTFSALTIDTNGALALGSNLTLLGNLGVGTTTPNWSFQIASITPYLALTDTDAAVNKKHILISNNDGIFKIGTSTDALDSTSTALSLDPVGSAVFGLGTTSPFGKLAVNPIAGDTNQFVVGSSTATSFIIDPAGNVGIGLTTPTSKLHVSGTLFVTGGATTSNFSTTFASTSSLWISGAGYTTTNCLQVDTTGKVSGTGSACGGAGGTPAGSGTELQYRNGASFGAVSTSGYNSGGNFLGLGTTTPRWLLQLATSTRSQLVLSDGSLTADQWAFRSVGGNFYLASSSAATFATTSIPSISIIAGGQAGLIGIGSSTPWGKFSVEIGNTHPAFVVSNQGSSTPAFFISSALQNGHIGIGTSTPQWPLQVVYGTRPQLTLSDGIGGNLHWSFRAVGNSFFLATSSDSTYATSSVSALAIDSTGSVTLSNHLNVLGNATATSATTTNFFAVTASSTNLFAQSSNLLGAVTLGNKLSDILTIKSGTISMSNFATTTIPKGTNAWSIATSTAVGSQPIFSISTDPTNGATSTVSFFSATSSGLFTAGAGNSASSTLKNSLVIGSFNQPAGVNIVNGGLCVDNDGWCAATTTGRITARQLLLNAAEGVGGGGADIAEMYPTNDATLSVGEVVAIAEPAGYVKRAQRSDLTLLAGIVSTQPGLTLAYNEDATGPQVPVALAGRVPVKVSTENGAIKAGDFLTLSSTPGVAMRMTKAGTAVGQAMEAYSGTQIGTVLTFVKNSYYSGERFDNMTPADILTALMSENTSTPTADLAVDHLTAGLDIIAPKVITNELTATSIKSPVIDSLLASIATLTARFDGFSGSATSAPQAATSTAGLSIDSVGTSGMDLAVLGDPEFFGRPYFTKDTAGRALIKKGARSVDITFERSYIETPIVSANIALEASTTNISTEEMIFDQDVRYLVTHKGITGFTILLNKPAPADIDFSWTAFAVKDAALFTSRDDSSEPIPSSAFDTTPVQQVVNDPDSASAPDASSTADSVISLPSDESGSSTPSSDTQN